MHVSDSKEEGGKVTRCTNKGNVDILLIREGEAAISVPLKRRLVLTGAFEFVYVENRWGKKSNEEYGSGNVVVVLVVVVVVVVLLFLVLLLLVVPVMHSSFISLVSRYRRLLLTARGNTNTPLLSSSSSPAFFCLSTNLLFNVSKTLGKEKYCSLILNYEYCIKSKENVG